MRLALICTLLFVAGCNPQFGTEVKASETTGSETELISQRLKAIEEILNGQAADRAEIVAYNQCHAKCNKDYKFEWLSSAEIDALEPYDRENYLEVRHNKQECHNKCVAPDHQAGGC